MEIAACVSTYLYVYIFIPSKYSTYLRKAIQQYEKQILKFTFTPASNTRVSTSF